MNRAIALMFIAVTVMLAGCQGESAGQFASEHRSGLIGGGVGAGLGGIIGQAIGRNTTSTLLGAGVGAGLGYLLGNEYDKKRAQEYNIAQPTVLTGTQWQIEQLNVPNAPPYQAMYLSFLSNSQVVTTTVLPDGRVTKAVETYRISDHTLIINKGAVGDQPGYIINANYAVNGNTMVLNSPDFSATLTRVNQVPS